jgi:hypothetical protein
LFKTKIDPQKHSKAYKPITAITLILLMTMSAALIIAQPVNAHDPPLQIPSYAFLAISPNPVGVGQSVYLVMWLHAAPYTADGIAGDRYHDFSIEVTKPDNSQENFGPYISDPTGSYYISYTPNQIGTYKFVFKYTGQIISLYNPENGLPGSTSRIVVGNEVAGNFINDTLLPSTATEYLTVQQEQIAPVEEYPLPTGYWTRPIEGQNDQWRSIASNWLNGAYFGTFQQTGYNIWQPNGQGPETPHIMWTRPIELGGLVGGVNAIPSVGFYSGGSYEGRFANSMIISGILYYQEPLGHSNTGGGFTAVNLRTGEVIWHRDDIGTIGGSNPPTFAELFDYESMNQHGVVGGMLWATPASTQYDPSLGSIWVGYDAFTGKMTYNLTNLPRGTDVCTDQGAIVRYVLDYNHRWLALWNSTEDQQGLEAATGTGSSAYQWRPNGKQVDMSKAYSWNVTIPDLPGNGSPAIYAILPGDVIFGTSSPIASGVGDKFTPDPFTVWAISDNPDTRGQLLWIKNYPAPEGNLTRRLGPVDPVNRVWTMSDVETMQWLGYSLDNGTLLWGPTNTKIRAYEYYGSGEGGGQRGATAYGNLYVQGFGGEIYCYNTLNGALLWKFNNTNSGIDTPWGLRPIFLSAIADGKVYAFNNEHSPNQPLYHGNKIYCIDAFTGQEIYSMQSWSGQTGGRGTSTAVLADGYLAYYNYYDGQIYCVGKGPSETTVTATAGLRNTITIQGSVMDKSAGAKQLIAKGLFNTVPAMSDNDQAIWMEYLYMQHPKPTDATGVTVKLSAIDPNGNYQDIGTAVSDSNGNYGYMWTPPVPGMYQITATFEGSDAYGPSEATTYLGVETATASAQPTSTPTSPTQTQTPPPTSTPNPTTTPSASTSPSQAPQPTSGMPITTYIAITAAVVIIAVAAAAIILRRRK